MIPLLEGWPTKSKEAPSPHEVIMSPMDTNPVFQSLGGSGIFIVTPSLEGLPTKAKEAPSPHEVRLALLDTNPVFLSPVVYIWHINQILFKCWFESNWYFGNIIESRWF